MSTRGISNLKSMTLQFCDFGGSSEGVRDMFKKKEFYQIINSKATTIFKFKLVRGHHPYITAAFINGFQKKVPLKKFSSEDILKTLHIITNEIGRKPIKHNGFRVTSYNKSIQGLWNNNMFNKDPIMKLQHFIPIPSINPNEELEKKGIKFIRTDKPEEHISKKISKLKTKWDIYH